MMLLQQQNTTHTTDSSPRSRDRMVHTPEGMALQEVIPSSALISMSARPRVWPASLPATSLLRERVIRWVFLRFSG